MPGIKNYYKALSKVIEKTAEETAESDKNIDKEPFTDEEGQSLYDDLPPEIAQELKEQVARDQRKREMQRLYNRKEACKVR